MKRTILILIGLFPLPLGYLLNYLLAYTEIVVTPGLLFFTGVVVLLLWFLMGIFSVRFFESKIEAIMLLNTPAVIILLISILFVILGREGMGYVGLSPQFFYFPFLRMGVVLLSGISNLLIGTYYTNTSDFMATLFLFLISFYGRRIGERRRS